MPLFEVTGPDGKRYQVEGPNEQGAINAVRSLGANKTSGPSVGEDIAKTIPAAGVRAAASVVGAPAGILDTVDKAWQWLVSSGLEKAGVWSPEKAEKSRQPIPGLEDTQFRGGIMPKPELFTGAVEKAVGAPLHRPQTVPGEYVGTAIEMAPGALLPGAALQRAGQVAVPALASETAGQAARPFGPAAEAGARMAGAVGGSVGVAAVGRPGTAAGIIREAAPNLTDAHINQARALIATAQQQGVQLTWPEALARATDGAVDIRQLQRFVENSPGGKSVMSEFMAGRGEQIQGAGNRAIGNLSDTTMDPFYTGTEVRRAAGREIENEQQNINAITRPLYQAAERESVTPQVATALADDPLYARTLAEIRGNPELNARVANLANDNAAVVELVQRRLGELAENRAIPAQASTSNLAAANLETARTAPRQAAEMATGGDQGYLAQARAIQERLRREHLEPLDAGPMGAMSRTADPMAQARALLPNQPPAGMDQTVSQTVRRVARQQPEAAANLVRTYAQTVFDEAIQRNAGTAGAVNPAGGAKFAAVIAGNPQQARNLEAAVRALPNGNQRWQGMQNFLETAEATGMRLAEGSGTSFNEIYKDMARRGSFAGEAAAIAGGVGAKGPARLQQWYQQMRMGRNTEQLARIITDPSAEPLLRQLSRARPGTPRAQALALRLTYLVGASEGSE